MAHIFYRPVIFIIITVLVCGQTDESVHLERRCSPNGEYGEHCTYVPAPPGHTPACAAPGYTYCEQLDYYPKDLIRHLVDKKQFDLSTVLTDETRDEFGATRPAQGPYGYGPNSLRGVQHISLVGQQPPPPPPPSQDQSYFPSPPFQERFPNHPNFRNTLPPPNGYVGYYTPSGQQNHQPFPPNGSWAFRSPLDLSQYEDFWRGNSYFEFPDFHRNNIGHQGEYYDNNGGRYYSPGRAPPAPYPQASAPAAPSGQGGARARPRRRSPRRPPLTVRSANQWWQREPQENSRSDKTEPPAVNSNDLKSKTFSERDTLTGNTKKANKSKAATNPLTGGRRRRQAAAPEQLCPTRSRYIMPRAALNKQGNWMYVVNMGDTTDPAYSQLVKTETCVSQECNGLCNLPPGYSSRCEQRYVQKRLVALDQGGQRLYNDVFWFPSCCLCTISGNPT